MSKNSQMQRSGFFGSLPLCRRRRRAWVPADFRVTAESQGTVPELLYAIDSLLFWISYDERKTSWKKKSFYEKRARFHGIEWQTLHCDKDDKPRGSFVSRWAMILRRRRREWLSSLASQYYSLATSSEYEVHSVSHCRTRYGVHKKHTHKTIVSDFSGVSAIRIFFWIQELSETNKQKKKRFQTKKLIIGSPCFSTFLVEPFFFFFF